MTEQPQPDESKPEEDLKNEFRNLGQTLVEAMRTAWDSPERKHLQQEIESGLNELGATLRKESESFHASPTGQRLKGEVEDLQDRIRSGEVESRLRQELISALKAINTGLQQATERWSSAPEQAASQEDAPSETPEGEA